MDPAALDAILYQCRTQRSAVDRYIEASGRQDMSRAEATEALFAAIASCGWALLVAPELWALACEWWTIARIEGYIERLNSGAELVSTGLHKPATMVVMEVKTGKLVEHEKGLIGERKVGPDLASVRLGALTNATVGLAKAEAELARARARFVRCTYAYKQRLDLAKRQTPQEQAVALLERALLEDEKAVAMALLKGGETPSTALTILDDKARSERIAELLAKRKERFG